MGCGFDIFQKIKKIKIKDIYLINKGNSYIINTFGVEEYDLNEKGIENGENKYDFLHLIKIFLYASLLDKSEL